MFSLSRREYPDLLLSQDNLDDITDLWLDWHEQAWARSLRRLRSYQAVRLRLWGFPRPTGEVLARKLEANLAAAQFPTTVSLADPDYLTVTTVFQKLAEPCSLGPWLSLVDDAAFDGLLLFLELTVQDWPDLPEGPAAAGGTLVLCGQLREDGLLLKALWPVGLEPGLENQGPRSTDFLYS